jgi:hypothetical protein
MAQNGRKLGDVIMLSLAARRILSNAYTETTKATVLHLKTSSIPRMFDDAFQNAQHGIVNAATAAVNAIAVPPKHVDQHESVIPHEHQHDKQQPTELNSALNTSSHQHSIQQSLRSTSYDPSSATPTLDKSSRIQSTSSIPNSQEPTTNTVTPEQISPPLGPQSSPTSENIQFSQRPGEEVLSIVGLMSKLKSLNRLT